MHIKVFAAADWTRLSQEPAELVKFSSRGLMPGDRYALVKRAGEQFADLVRDIEILPGEAPIHSIAMGATESTGQNRNADGFRFDELVKHANTFVKFAKRYRNHCFTAETQVLLSSRQRKPINEIRIGDEVITTEGPSAVTDVFKRRYSGPGVQIRLSGVPEVMTVTPEHPVFVFKREQIHCRHKYSRLWSNPHSLQCPEWRNGLANMVPDYHEVRNVAEGDYLLIPIPTAGTFRVAPEFARLIGWVASEGYIHRNEIHFTFSASNRADIHSVTTCLEALGSVVTRYDRDDGLVQLYTTHPDLAHTLIQYVTGTKQNKRLTGRVLNLAPDLLLELLAAYIEGDGHVAASTSHNTGQLRIRSSAPGMRKVLLDIIRAVGIPATEQVDKEAGTMISPTNGQVYDAAESGVVSVAAGFSIALAGGTRKNVVRGSTRHNRELCWEGYQLARVLQMSPVTLREPVYNLEVAGPDNYVAGEVVVHNCNKDPKNSFGKVKFAWVNPDMKRVELLQVLNETKEAAERNDGKIADQELDKLHSGKALPESMSCKIAFDVCSACGNKAPTRADYCRSQDEGGSCSRFGCANGLGKVAEDGFAQYVDNPKPVFFDISTVGRNADRVAFGHLADYLEKAASANRVVGGSELGELWNIAPPLALALSEADPRCKAAMQTIYLLASVEDEMTEPEAGVKSAAARLGLSYLQDQLPTDLGWMGTYGSRKQAAAMSALASKQVLLPLPTFLHIATGQPIEKCAEIAPYVQEALPGVFGRLLAATDVQRQLVSNPFAIDVSARPTDEQLRQAEKLAAAYSLQPDRIRLRARLASLRGHTDSVKKANDASLKRLRTDSSVEDLARSYALYKIAFVSVQTENLPLTASNAVYQNYK